MSPCPCRASATFVAGVTSNGMAYGEKGLDLVSCVAPEPYSRIGDTTGYLYPFQVRREMYVDRRDTLFILSDDFRLAGEP
jgi:hypothetical protein